jgi:phosphotransferase system HPr (HPr) family protein
MSIAEVYRLRTDAVHSTVVNSYLDIRPMPTASRETVISNKLGLHARPAMQFVDVANQFAAAVKVLKGGEEPGEADGKSVMQMIILAAVEGTPLTIEADGEDAQRAVDKLAELVESKFGEED